MVNVEWNLSLQFNIHHSTLNIQHFGSLIPHPLLTEWTKTSSSIPTRHFTIEGRSRAGHETWFRVRELASRSTSAAVPIAVIGMPHIFVTHAHLDHALGIPFYAGQRHLQRIEGGRVYVPAEAADDFRALMALHEKLEGTHVRHRDRRLAVGESLRIGRTHEVRAHRATHRVAARAYEVSECAII